MQGVDSPWNVESPWDGSMSIEVTVDQVLQSILAGSLIFTAIALLVGIVEALRPKWWRRPRYVRLGVYSAISTILLAAALLSAYPLRNVSQPFLSTLSYVSIVLLAELIPIVAIDGVRETFISETPLLSDILKPLEKKSEARVSRVRLSEPVRSGLELAERTPEAREAHESERIEEASSPSCTEPKPSHVASASIGSSEHEGRQARPENVNARRRVVVDPDYEKYCEWALRKGLFLWELEYGEFAKLRKIVNQVLGEGSFGMRGSKIGLESLCLLAKIDAREDVEKLRRKYPSSFRRLRKFKLVSDRGRLMPRGVRLVKALKKEGLIERLREQPI